MRLRAQMHLGCGNPGVLATGLRRLSKGLAAHQQVWVGATRTCAHTAYMCMLCHMASISCATCCGVHSMSRPGA